MSNDEVVAALVNLIQQLQGFQTAHRANIANANAPVAAATQALTDAQAAVTKAQADLDAATANAAATVASETAAEAEDQTGIDGAAAIITQLGGTPPPPLPPA